MDGHRGETEHMDGSRSRDELRGETYNQEGLRGETNQRRDREDKLSKNGLKGETEKEYIYFFFCSFKNNDINFVYIWTNVQMEL